MHCCPQVAEVASAEMHHQSFFLRTLSRFPYAVSIRGYSVQGGRVAEDKQRFKRRREQGLDPVGDLFQSNHYHSLLARNASNGLKSVPNRGSRPRSRAPHRATRVSIPFLASSQVFRGSLQSHVFCKSRRRAAPSFREPRYPFSSSYGLS